MQIDDSGKKQNVSAHVFFFFFCSDLLYAYLMLFQAKRRDNKMDNSVLSPFGSQAFIKYHFYT